MAELKTLHIMLEVIKNGKSIIGKQRIIDRLLGGDWMSKQHNLANNNAGSGRRGSNSRNAPILQGKPSAFIRNKAFRNIIRNLFEIQVKAATEIANKNSHYILLQKVNFAVFCEVFYLIFDRKRDII